MGLQYSFRQVRCEEVTTGPLESIPSAHINYSFRQVRCEEVTTGPLESIPSTHIKLQPICDLTRVAFPEKESWGGLSFYPVRALGFGLQIIVYSQADHVASTILETNVNFLQRFYRASLGTPSRGLINRM